MNKLHVTAVINGTADKVILMVNDEDYMRVFSYLRCGERAGSLEGKFDVFDLLSGKVKTLRRDGCCGLAFAS